MHVCCKQYLRNGKVKCLASLLQIDADKSKTISSRERWISTSGSLKPSLPNCGISACTLPFIRNRLPSNERTCELDDISKLKPISSVFCLSVAARCSSPGRSVATSVYAAASERSARCVCIRVIENKSTKCISNRKSLRACERRVLL